MKDGVALRWSGRARARALRRRGGARSVVIDTDGCLTDGRLYIDQTGAKPMKAYGLDDHAAIEHWSHFYDIHIISSDKQPLAEFRATHMKVPFHHVPADPYLRLEGIKRITGFDATYGTVYIGDGYHDADVMKGVAFGIAPNDAWPKTLRAADAVTSRAGGRRSVAQALDFIGLQLGRR